MICDTFRYKTEYWHSQNPFGKPPKLPRINASDNLRGL
ncbi:hypothetical protein EMIT048CA2_30025 [Pseudomonas chlororaphis]